MLSGYYKIERTEQGVGARKLFAGDAAVFSNRPEFTVFKEGSIVLVADEPVSGDRISLLARGGTARARVWNILDDYAVDPQYPDRVHEEVNRVLKNPGFDDPDLEDMTDLAFVTIDNEDSRDLDQAMFIRTDDHGYTVYYALADAAYYVAVGSALFDNALVRGASYYLPEFSVPMLPSALSEGLISLNPEVLRRAMVFVIRLNNDAEVIDSRIQRARIFSRAKLSYNGVQAFHDDPASSPLGAKGFTDTLLLLRVIGEKRIDLARQRNVVEYDRLSLNVQTVGENGERFTISEDRRLDVESWNEQISLLCNHEGANLLREALERYQIQPIFRVHLAPEPERLKKFSALLDALIAEHDLPRETWVWRWRDGSYGAKETIAEYLRRLPPHPSTLPVRRAIQHQAQMLNSASVFTAEPGPHHSLKLDGYARFSSPMREVAGIFTHQEIIEFCAQPGTTARHEDLSLRDRVIDAANHSRQLQKQLTKAVYKLAIDDLFREDLAVTVEQRPVRSGTIFGIRPTRLYLRLDDPAIDVKLYAEDLEKIYNGSFEHDSAGAVLFSRDAEQQFILGQTLQIRIESYDSQRGRWLLLPVRE